MANGKEIKPTRLKFNEIRKRADEFRTKYWPGENIVPLDLETVIESDLRIRIDPIFDLVSESGVEAFLSKDSKSIYVDSRVYYHDEKRLRFTLAHEIGHLVLHKEIYDSFRFSDIEDWSEFIQNINDDDYDWFERQAKEFAGRLLVPPQILKRELINLKEEIIKYVKKCKSQELELNKEILAEGIGRKLSNKFGVSYHVIKYRILRENQFEEIGIEF